MDYCNPPGSSETLELFIVLQVSNLWLGGFTNEEFSLIVKKSKA
jgi:hypothetical protein